LTCPRCEGSGWTLFSIWPILSVLEFLPILPVLKLLPILPVLQPAGGSSAGCLLATDSLSSRLYHTPLYGDGGLRGVGGRPVQHPPQEPRVWVTTLLGHADEAGAALDAYHVLLTGFTSAGVQVQVLIANRRRRTHRLKRLQVLLIAELLLLKVLLIARHALLEILLIARLLLKSSLNSRLLLQFLLISSLLWDSLLVSSLLLVSLLVSSLLWDSLLTSSLLWDSLLVSSLLPISSRWLGDSP